MAPGCAAPGIADQSGDGQTSPRVRVRVGVRVKVGVRVRVEVRVTG